MNVFDVLKKVALKYNMNNGTNGSTKHLVSGLILGVNAVGIVENLLLIIAHLKDPLKSFKSPSSLFIFIIAIVDLHMSCTTILINLHISSMAFMILHAVMDLLHPFLFIMYLSLAIERFSSIAFPFWHRVDITIRFCRYWVTVTSSVWTITRASSFALKQTNNFKVLLDLTRILFLWITFLVTQCVYIASYISIKKQNKKLQARQDMNKTTMKTIKLRPKNENNFLVTIAIACLILGITTLPFLIMTSLLLVDPLGKDSKVSSLILRFICGV